MKWLIPYCIFEVNKHRNVGAPFINTIVRYCEWLLANASFSMNEKPNEILYKIFYEELTSIPNLIDLFTQLKLKNPILYKKLTLYADKTELTKLDVLGDKGFGD